MAKAKKLPSGSWRTRVFSHTEIVDGKEKKIYRSFTADTKQASELMAAQFVVNKEYEAHAPRRVTVGKAIDDYIAANEGVLSPSTIESYKKIRLFAFQNLMNVDIRHLNKITLQAAISAEAKRLSPRGKPLSPKTVKNEYGLISSALKAYDIHFEINLPKTPTRFVELPTADIVLSAVKGSRIELPVLLACWLSFSMSEVRGIKCSSIRNGCIYIEQVLLTLSDGDREKLTGKAEKRQRKHKIPSYIMQLINEQESYKEYLTTGSDGFLVNMTRNQIYHPFVRIMEKEGFPTMSFHQLRHLNASVMALLQVPEKYAMERGGWKTPHTMKSVYQHTFSTERERVDALVDDFFEEQLKKIDKKSE